jgi:hypothetical protein
MSETWHDRFRRDWMAYLRSHVARSRYRAAGWMPTIEEYEAARRDSIASDIGFDLIERAGRFEVPQHVRGCVPMREMMAAAASVYVYLNDLLSVGAEAASEAVSGNAAGNILLLTAARLGCTPAEAEPIVRRRVGELLAGFDAARSDLSREADYTTLGARQREDTDRFVLGMKRFAAGFLHWATRNRPYLNGAG